MKIKLRPKTRLGGDRPASDLSARGIYVPTLPDKAISALGEGYRLPPDITRVTSRELSQLMSRCVEYRAYLLAQIAIQDNQHTAECRKRDRLRARLILHHGDDAKWKGSAAVDSNTEYQHIEDECDKIAATLNVMQAVADGLTEKYGVLSREITRREMDANVHR